MKLSNIFSETKIIVQYLAFGFLFLMLTGLASCSDELVQNGDKNEAPAIEGEKLYLSFNIVPVENNGETGTRATEDNENDTEYVQATLDGESWENNVEKLAALLVNPDDHKTVWLTVEFEKPTESEGVYNGKTVLDYTLDEVKDFIAKGLAAKAEEKDFKVEIYAVCNYQDGTLPAVGDVLTDSNLIPSSNMTDFGGFTTGTGANPFLMTNGDYLNSSEDSSKDKYIATIDIDALMKSTTEDNSYNINPKNADKAPVAIPVQRALARVDIKINNNIYYFDEFGGFIGDNSGNIADWTTKIQIEHVGLVNINKNFNLFKSTGNALTGNFNSDWGFFWAEMPSSGDDARYVQDPKYSEKKNNLASSASLTSKAASAKASTYYDNYFLDPKTFLKDGNLNPLVFKPFIASSFKKRKETSDYYIWQYLIPNTIHEAAMQKVGISTGIVFVSYLNFKDNLGEGTNDNVIQKEEEDKDERFDPVPIYMYDGTPIGTNYELQQIVANPKTTRQQTISKAYKAAVSQENLREPENYQQWKTLWNTTGKAVWADFTAFKDWEYTDDEPLYYDPESNGTEVNPAWTEWAEKKGDDNVTNLDKKARHFEVYNTLPSNGLAQELVDNKFSIIVPTTTDHLASYRCYYYGWLRHNNNNNPTVMGPMEFGVVRNNVYQVSLNRITHLGHPFPLEDIPTDPEPPTPFEDDELKDPYLELTFKVSDWNVKKNTDIGLGH